MKDYDYVKDNRDGYIDAQAKLDKEYQEHLERVEKMKNNPNYRAFG